MLRLDLVPRETKLNGTVTSLGLVGSEDYLSRNTLGLTADTGGFLSIPLSNQFENGTTFASGQYRFLASVLKVFGDQSNDEDWERWLSPIVGVL